MQNALFSTTQIKNTPEIVSVTSLCRPPVHSLWSHTPPWKNCSAWPPPPPWTPPPASPPSPSSRSPFSESDQREGDQERVRVGVKRISRSLPELLLTGCLRRYLGFRGVEGARMVIRRSAEQAEPVSSASVQKLMSSTLLRIYYFTCQCSELESFTSDDLLPVPDIASAYFWIPLHLRFDIWQLPNRILTFKIHDNFWMVDFW